MDRQVVLVTGSAGFIGTNIVKTMLDKGYAVIALDINAPGHICPGYRYTYTGDTLGMDADIWIVRGDVRDTKLLRKLFDGAIDYVIHLAAVSTIQMGAEDAAKTMSVNIGGTEALLSVIKEHGGVRGLIYASTDKVYGRLLAQSYTENDVLDPLDSPYDRSKAQADRMVRKWCTEYGIHGIVLRFCNIYGMYDLHDTRIVPGTIRAMLEGRECVLRMYRDFGGKARNFMRDLLYVGDLCETIGLVMDRLELWNQEENIRSAQWGEAFNLGASCCYSMDEVIWTIQDIIGRKESPRVEIVGTQEEIPRQRMDYTKAQNCFGFVPRTSLEEGLRKTVGWWRECVLMYREYLTERGRKDDE